MAGRQKTGKRPKPKTVLRIPDLEQSKYAVLNSRGSIRSQRCFGARQNLCQAPKRRREGELMTCSGRSVAARSPMRGGAWPGDGGGQCIDKSARPWSRRSPRACRCGTLASARAAASINKGLSSAGRASRFPPVEPVREAGARTDNACSRLRAHRRIRLCCARALRRAFADGRRIVAGDTGGRVRTQNAYPSPSDLRAPRPVPRISPPGVPSHVAP
jgi:hypothetical protein